MLQVDRREPSRKDDLQHPSLEMLQVNVNALQVTADLQHIPDSEPSALLDVLQVSGPESPALQFLLQVSEALLQFMGLLLQVRADLQHPLAEMLRIFEWRTLRSRICRKIPEELPHSMRHVLQVSGDLLQVS